MGATTREPPPPADGTESRVRRSFNEAAHKLGYWPVGPAPRHSTEDEPSEALKAARDDDRDVVAHAGKAVLALGALGIVYGDIGTSPLYDPVGPGSLARHLHRAGAELEPHA